MAVVFSQVENVNFREENEERNREWNGQQTSKQTNTQMAWKEMVIIVNPLCNEYRVEVEE